MIHPRQKDLFAVIGNPVAHSLSPVMMQEAFDTLGLPALYVALESDSLAEDLDTLWKMRLRGLSVTLPHKEAAYSHSASKDETAAAIGAVNTLRWHISGWEARNTDWIGSNRALERFCTLKGKRALVLGAGGAARAVVYGLLHAGASVHITNRSVERGETLAGLFACDFIPLHELERVRRERPFEIVIQCTSTGLVGTEKVQLVSDSFFQPGMVVMDTVYRPLWTDFLDQAKRAGSLTVPGLEMLLHQGVAQLEWWLGIDSLDTRVIQVMRNALIRASSHE
jgi:shikimate dehydrogenase